MPKSSPEKLAKALRANLKKRKSEGRPAPKDDGAETPELPESGAEPSPPPLPRAPTG